MSQLMEVDICKLKSLCNGWSLTFKKEGFIVCHTSNVLHGSVVMLWYKDLIIFSEWVLSSEIIFVAFHANSGDSEHFFTVNWHQGLSSVDSHWWEAFFNVFNIVERSYYDGIKVRRNSWSGLKVKTMGLIDVGPSFFLSKRIGDLF